MKQLARVEDARREELMARVVEQFETIQSQEQQIASLTSQVSEQSVIISGLKVKIADLERRLNRQATPFSTGEHVKNPKRSGRKKGQGRFTHRQAPSPEEWTEPPIDVKVALECCPDCGGHLEEERIEIATVTELPEVIRPSVQAYRVSVCQCAECGKRVRGQHPDLAPDQFGATAHRLGPRVKAAGHVLHYRVGIPVRKVPEVLEELCGVSVTQSALTQDALKQAEPPSEKGAASSSEKALESGAEKALESGAEKTVESGAEKKTGGKIGEAYQALRESVKEAPTVNTDDTGWRIGGETAFLMTFVTPSATVYQIRRRHRNDEVRELIPGDYGGVMGCDRGKSYDAKELARVRQQKCLSHIDRSLKKETEGREGNDRQFPEVFRSKLFEGMDLWKEFKAGTIDRPQYDEAGAIVKKDVTLHLLLERLRLLREAPEPEYRSEVDRSNARILDGIGWHQTMGNLMRFLDNPEIEPTNNGAERALRPAVIARKVSHCSKTDRGAEASAAFASVIQTLAKSGGATVEKLAEVMLVGRIALPGLSPPPSD